MQTSVELCIIGTGPTARICSHFFKQIPHLLIGDHQSLGSLAKSKIDELEINLIPIFPVFDSPLYHSFWKESVFEHTFLDSIDIGDISSEFNNVIQNLNNACPTSYASTCWSKSDDIQTKKNIVLAYKLFGDIIFTESLDRLYAKVERHYGLKVPGKRIAFADNISPYYDKINEISIDNVLCEEIVSIDIEKKNIHTESSTVRYSKLISTINLSDFFVKVTNAPDVKLISRSASFFLFKINKCVAPNKVIYDIVADSPIYRVFTINSNILIVQLSYIHRNIDSKLILGHLYKLLDQTFAVELEHYYQIKDAYPLASSSELKLQQYLSELKSKKVFMMGRFAQWEYIDLHELNYLDLYANIFNQ